LRDLPSPPWGRGWTAAGVLFSRGGPGEGVVGLRPFAVHIAPLKTLGKDYATSSTLSRNLETASR